jgi:hypothetical protein
VIKKRNPVLLVLIMFSAGTLCAQVSGTRFLHDVQSPAKDGKVTISQSEDISKLIDRHLSEESKKQGIVGYRIRIFSNSGARARKEGEDIMARFLQRFDGVKTYYNFDSPFYRLYVGDFRSRSEAMKFQKRIEIEYPDAFIVRCRINYPSLEILIN